MIDLNRVLSIIDQKERKRVSLSEIARNTGISIVTLSRIKNGRVASVRASTIARICASYPYLIKADFESLAVSPRSDERS